MNKATALIMIIFVLLLAGCSKLTDEKTNDSIVQSNTSQNTTDRVESHPVEGAIEENEGKSTDQRKKTNDLSGNEKALEKAKRYVKAMALSYDGVIEHLEMIGFTSDEAKYGADNCGADWNEQAARHAAIFKNTSYSKDKVIEILENKGFTHEQAVYGAEQNGFE